MKYLLEDLLDISALKKVLTNFYEFSEVPVTLINSAGRPLISIGWIDICTKFHRKNPFSSARCAESDSELFNSMLKENSQVLKKCSNGLLELGSKITIDNVFMGSIVVGQFLTEKPDINFFMEQARNYGFNEPEYILAVKKIPLISHEKINAIVQFVTSLTFMIAQVGYKRLKELELINIMNITQDRLTNVEGFYSQLLDILPDPCIIMGLSGEIRTASKKALQLFDYTLESFSKMKITQVIEPQSIKDASDDLAALKSCLEITSREYCLKTSKGKIFYAAVNSKLLYDIHGSPNAIVCSLRKIENFSENDESSLKVQISLSNLFDINLIAALYMKLQLRSLTAENKDALYAANGFSWSSTDGKESTFHLKDAILAAAQAYRPKIGKLNITMENSSDMAPDLIISDFHALARILYDIFAVIERISGNQVIKINVSTFNLTPQKLGISFTLDSSVFSIDEFSGTYRFSWTDYSLADDLFFRLPYLKALVSSMKPLFGEMQVLFTKSLSRLTLEFAFKNFQNDTALSSECFENQSGGKKSMSDLNVLVAEDDFINQKLIGNILAKEKISCFIVSDGQKAVDEYIRNPSYDFILMDIQMPVMNGIDASNAIRKINPTVPIVALTADLSSEDKDMLKAARIDKLLVKPFQTSDLLETLKIMNICTSSSEESMKELIGKVQEETGLVESEVQELLGDYVKYTSSEFEILGEMVEKNDFEGISKLSHKLKGSSLSLRISNIAEILQKMDEDAKNKNNLNFQDYLDELDIYLKAIKNGLSGQR